MSSPRLAFLVLVVTASCGRPPAPEGRETITLTLHEGTQLGFDLSPDGRSIVLDLLGQLWLLPAEGGTARPLTDAARDTAEDLDPSFLPDGRGVVFQGERAGRIGLWLLGLDSARPRLVTELDPDDSGPLSLTIGGVPVKGASWARDGHAVAYFAPDSAGLPRLWIRARGGPARLLAPQLDVSPTRVRWTGDGRSLLYSANGRLWRIADTGGTAAEIPFTASLRIDRARRVLPPARFPTPGRATPARGFTALAIAPDGRRAAMVALGQLWVVAAEGQPRSVARVPDGAMMLTWRPDGAAVTWSGGVEGEEDLFTTSIDAGTTTRVTALRGRELFPAWSPDGAHLAFMHLRDSARLGVMPGDARGEVKDWRTVRDLGTIPDDGSSSPVWSPESDGLLVPGPRYRAKSTAEFVPLRGPRIRLERFPDSPIFLQWTRDTLVFVRHDRLWKAPFDRDGLRAAPVPVGPEPALYLSASSEGSILFVSEGGLRWRRPDGSVVNGGWPVTFTPPIPEPLLLRNVKIIDGTGAAPTGPSDVLIERGRIARIAAPGSIATEARALDGTGQVMIPGLMDLHAHVYRPAMLPSMAYFGITTVRDQGSSMATLVAYADLVAAGLFAGPRVSYGGFQYYSDWAFDEDQGRGIEPEADSGHVARSIALAAAFGAQHVKTRTFRRWDINARLIEAAHRLGMRATGHCSHEPPLVLAGMDAKEHIGMCASRVDGDLYDDVIGLFRSAGVAVIPTISYTALAARLSGDPGSLEADPELAPFLPAREDFGWMLRLDEAARRQMQLETARARTTTLKLLRAGVTVGLGTDVWQVPTAVHMELEELVAAGLTPLEALHAATGAAAKVIGAETDFGTIQEGMRADLVILDADPTVDIRHTRKIAWVLRDGAIVDRDAIRKAVSSKQ